MANKKVRRKLNSRVKRTIRKTSAAVLMASAIAVAAIPAGNIEAESRETNTGIVIEDTRTPYVYPISDTRAGFTKTVVIDDEGGTDTITVNEPDSASAPDSNGYFLKVNDAKLSSYHRNNGSKEGYECERSYSVRQNSQGYYMNWQFEYDSKQVLCKYNDNFAESIVELPYQVATKYYQVSQETFDNFYSVGHKGSEHLVYKFDNWNKEVDKANPELADAPIITAYFPDRMTAFIKLCQQYLDKYNAEIEKYDTQIEDLNRQLLSGDLTPEQRTEIEKQRDDLVANPPLGLSARTDKPELDLDPSTNLNLKEQCKYFCEFFVPGTDGATEADKKLKKLSSYGKGSDFTIEFAYDESSGAAKPVYLAKYNGSDELGLGAKKDNLGFLITEFSESPITAIGDYAFYNVKSIDTLILPAEIQYIGDYAFATSFMKQVSMPNVRNVGNGAFKNCGQLTKITLDTALLSVIGAEAFYGTALTELVMPYSISEIGAGAFAACTSLKKIDLSAVTTSCQIKEAAFYDAMSLTEIKFPPATSKSITGMGNGALAVELANAPLAIELPANMDTLPNHLFYGRSNLQYVVMPSALGYTAAKKAVVPETTFMGCSNLQYVLFPEEAKYVSYGTTTTYKDADGKDQDVFRLFMDVDTPGFYVQGPAYSTGTVEAIPRQDTWNCVTNVNNFVPYVYVLDGITYYEVSDGKYILTANELGELLSCRARSTGSALIDLVIPKKVGNYTIKTIADGCFEDENLRKRLRSITIEDDTISEIRAEVFKNLPKLKEVDLGNSVSSIGDRAFAGCEALEDVTFRAEQVSLGAEAFATGGTELTFHGKIAADFGPFSWAMQKENLVRSNGVRVCYKSLSPSLLTVMYDDGTDLVTLVDYPKYKDMDDLHVQDSVNYWYNLYSTQQYDSIRNDFYEAWKAAVQLDDATLKADAIKAVYDSDSLYGPWISPRYCEEVRQKLLSEPPVAPGGGEGAKNTLGVQLLDSVFPAMVAHAASDKPIPFFAHEDHQYTIIGKDATTGKTWDEYTAEENAWIDACINIVIPSGVQSIDAKGYFKNTAKNGTNISTYFLSPALNPIPAASSSMYINNHAPGPDGKEVYPGLFSGYYEDYGAGEEKDTYEKSPRGNDRIKSITMTDVQYLPDFAFDSCERLEKVVLGSAMQDIGTLPFYGCMNLKDVIGNDYYIGDNGLIMSTQEPGNGVYTLVECLQSRGTAVGGRSLPDSGSESEAGNIAKIGAMADRAFEDCDDIRIIDLSESTIKTVPERCFENCDALDMVYLPYTTNVIKADAFKDDKMITVSIPSKEVFIATDAFEHGAKAKADPGDGRVTFNTYPESAAAEYARYYDINLNNMELTHTVWYNDYNGVPLIDKPFYVKDGDVVAADERPAEPTRPGYEFDKWLSNTGVPEGGRIYEDTIFTATYVPVAGTHDGKFYVEFYDGVTGEKLGDRQEIESGGEATPPEPPEHDNYTFLKWSNDDYLKVEKDLVVTALYSPGSSGDTPGGGDKPGDKPGGGGNSGGGGGNSGGGNSSGGESGGNGNGQSGNSGNSNTTPATKYTVTVVGGTGGGTYESGATVAITANAPEAGKAFSKWTTDSSGVNFTNAAMSATTFKMPASNVTVTANYVDSAATTTPVAGATTTTLPPGYGSGYGENVNDNKKDDNNAQVSVSKPGISNIDLATAKVNGSSDSFVIKVTETNEAEEKVKSALINRYGNLENRIEYWACDISLYDSTGNNKIEDTNGLTVDITLPIPDELKKYGGNNMVGAVAEGSLESLTPRFNEINGVPCVTFTATHFSPYTIYVDTQNLSASQMMDATPKTGDPIHPKWFLSIGLACVSVLLFMKKDKKQKKLVVA